MNMTTNKDLITLMENDEEIKQYLSERFTIKKFDKNLQQFITDNAISNCFSNITNQWTAKDICTCGNIVDKEFGICPICEADTHRNFNFNAFLWEEQMIIKLKQKNALAKIRDNYKLYFAVDYITYNKKEDMLELKQTKDTLTFHINEKEVRNNKNEVITRKETLSLLFLLFIENQGAIIMDTLDVPNKLDLSTYDISCVLIETFFKPYNFFGFSYFSSMYTYYTKYNDMLNVYFNLEATTRKNFYNLSEDMEFVYDEILSYPSSDLDSSPYVATDVLKQIDIYLGKNKISFTEEETEYLLGIFELTSDILYSFAYMEHLKKKSDFSFIKKIATNIVCLVKNSTYTDLFTYLNQLVQQEGILDIESAIKIYVNYLAVYTVTKDTLFVRQIKSKF